MSAKMPPDPRQGAVNAVAEYLQEQFRPLTRNQATILAAKILGAAEEGERQAREAFSKWMEAERQRLDGEARARERADASRGARERAAMLSGGRAAHQILGVPANADEAEIRAAWKRRAQVCHPDKGGSNAMMSDLNAARDAMLRRPARV